MMEPGRELDALMAEKVFGWRWVTLEHSTYLGGGKVECLTRPGTESAESGLYEFGVRRGVVAEGCPKYSALFALIPMIIAELPSYTFQLESHHRHGAFARVILPGECMVDRPTQTWESQGHSIPHALCLATLQAMEDKDITVDAIWARRS